MKIQQRQPLLRLYEALLACDNAIVDGGPQAVLFETICDTLVTVGGLQRDVQRKEAEYAMLESEVHYNALFASNCMPLTVLDPGDGQVIDASILAMNFCGWDHASITAKHIDDINALGPAQVREQMAIAVSAKRRYFACKHRLASSEVRIMLGVGNKAAGYPDFDVQTLQWLQSEEMASIGQRASGVAYEINNPVGFVKSNLGSLATYVQNLVEVVRERAELPGSITVQSAPGADSTFRVSLPIEPEEQAA